MSDASPVRRPAWLVLLWFAGGFAALYPALMAVTSGLPLSFLVSRLEGRGPRLSDAFTLFAREAPELLLTAYALGALPAAFAGLVVGATALKVRRWTWWVAAVAGALVPTLVLAGFKPLPVQVGLFGICGVLSALACTAVVGLFAQKRS